MDTGQDRGIYKTTDGGANWKLLLHPSDSVSAIDLSMDPANPRILYAAFWDFQRLPWQIRSGGPGSAIYRTADGGATWTADHGHGLAGRDRGPHRRLGVRRQSRIACTPSSRPQATRAASTAPTMTANTGRT